MCSWWFDGSFPVHANSQRGLGLLFQIRIGKTSAEVAKAIKGSRQCISILHSPKFPLMVAYQVPHVLEAVYLLLLLPFSTP